MEIIDFIGFAAGACTTVAVIPQIIKSWRTKKVVDVSPLMFSILILGVGLWVVYGIKKGDLPIIITNGISFLLNLSMLILMLFFKSNSNSDNH